MNVKATIEDNELILRLPLTAPKPSASGKTLVVASTRGNVVTDVEIDGRPVVVGCNAYIYPEEK